MQKVRGRLLLCTVSFSLSSTFIQAFALHRIISQTRRTSLPFSMTKHQHHHLAQSAGSLVSPLEKHGKSLPKVSMSTFLLTTAFIPVWAVTVLPMSFLYLAGSAALKPIVSVFRSSSRKLSSASTQTKQLDSGYVVFPAVIIPRADRQYDIVVLGATGFTGYLAARHLAKTYGVNKTVKWAIAGRSEVKLEKVKQDLAKELNMEEISALDTILVDTAMASTLPKLVSQTRVVATTAGPYALYGSQVVEFCAKFGTHYVDITGEVDWVKAMISQWQETAHKTGSRLIPFCGHDSIPWDLSVLKLQERLKEQGDNMSSVTFWDEARGGAPGGTFATIFNAVNGKSINAPQVDFDPFLRLPDGSESKHVCKANLPKFLAKSASPWDVSSPSRQWTTPFIMAAVNADVVRWTYALRSEGSYSMSYTEYALNPDFKTAFVSYAGMAMLGSMLFNPITSYVLENYLVPKPGEGPSIEAMENKHFLCVKGEAVGEKGKRAESIFFLNKDAGCLETSRLLVESGLCLALQEDALPFKTGGFTSPAAGLGCVLMERLVRTGTYFESQAAKSTPAA